MVKLFFRNKLIEIINHIYDNRPIYFYLGLIIATSYCCLFRPEYAKAYIIGILSIIVLGITILIGIALTEWIKHNIKLAKNNVKVPFSWKE